MKTKKLLLISAGSLVILAAMSSCASSRDYGNSAYQSAMQPAGTSTAPAPITEQDVERFETDLRTVMGSDAAETPKPTPKPVVESYFAKYYVITGSFEAIENAQAQKETLEREGHRAGIVEGPMGRFRVYAFAGNNLTEARQQLRILRDFYSDAWIFVNK